jgi:hypothetical protein
MRNLARPAQYTHTHTHTYTHTHTHTHTHAHTCAASPDPLTAVLATWRQLLQFAGMGLLVPFYAGNFADKNLPASDSARIG